MMPIKALVTGATGLLGRALAYENNTSEVLTLAGSYYPDKKYLSRELFAESYFLDIRDRDEVRRVVAATQAEIIINCASIAGVDYVEEHREEVYKNNFIGSCNVATVGADLGLKMIHISTNAVYAGTNAPYAESAVTEPLNYYGELKCREDAAVRQLFTPERFAIIRPILMYGWNDPLERANPLTWQMEMQAAGKALKIVDDIYCNPLLANDCAKAILQIIRRAAWDEYNLGGPERMNRYEMACRLSRCFGYPVAEIDPVPNSFFKTIAPRPRDTTMVFDKARQQLDYAPLTLEQAWDYLQENKY